MPNNVINKVVYGDRTLIDLTDTTADAADVASGKYFYAKDGVKTLGTGSIGGENGDVYQDAEGYIVLKPGAGTNVSVTPLSVTENGIYSAPTGVAYSPVEVSVGPARSLSDITVSGSIVSGPAGLYSEAFSKAVSAGSGILTAGGGGLSTSLTINSSTGLITKTSSSATFTVKMQSGTFVSGYFSSYTDVRAAAVTFTTSSSTIQLPTLAATTYTPTETSQTIDRYQWLTGSQTIAAISNTYVGTGIDRRSAADIYQSGVNVYAPSGYYSFTEVFQIPTTNHLDPVLTFVSSTGYIGAIHDAEDAIINNKIMRGKYGTSSSMTLPVFAATTWTPSSTNQYISSYQWLTGSQTILGDSNLIASNIKSGVSIFGVTGTVPDENDMPTVYQTWDDDLGGYTYSCNYTYNQILTMLTNLNGDPLAGELHDMNYDPYHGNWITYRYGGTWFIDDSYPLETYICLKTLYYKYIYHSNSLIESVNMDQDKEVIPSQNTQYINPDYPHEYLNYVKVLGDANLVPSNILSGVSIFGVQGTAAGGGDSLEDALVTRAASLTTYENSRITEIGPGAFAFNSTISIFSFPNVVSIGSSAFLGAKGSNSTWVIDLSRCNFSACTYIGASAFAEHPFSTSTRIQSTTFPLVTSAGQGAFMSGYITGAYFPSLSMIPAYFLAANYLSTSYNIRFPNAVEIGSYAFVEQYIAANDEGVYISEYNFANVELIRDHAFYGRVINSTQAAAWLTGVSLSKVSLIEGYAFTYQNKMKSARFSSVKSIGNYAFSSCTSLSDAYFPEVSYIGSNAFCACTSLSNINIPKVSYIGSYAFQSCYKLNSISCSNAISIETGAFAYCSSLISAYFPNATKFGIGVFSSCTSLQDINVENLVNLNTNAFYNCKALSSIYLPKVSEIIGQAAFYTCSSLEVADFGSASNIRLLSSSCFYYCQKLKSIYLPKVSRIGSSAFYSCTNMSFALFGTSYSSGSIFTNAFYNCQSLSSLYLLNEFYALQGIGVFNNTPMSNSSYTGSFGSIFVPVSLYDTYISATNWVTYSSRFVSMTDAEIETFLSTLT